MYAAVPLLVQRSISEIYVVYSFVEGFSMQTHDEELYTPFKPSIAGHMPKSPAIANVL